MTTQQIAERLAALCLQNDFETAQKELYAEDAISIEQEATPTFAKETKGLSAIIEKGHVFEDMVAEWHGSKVSEPLVTANVIALVLWMDLTFKQGGRMQMDELCVYHVKDGKIVSEQFFM